MAQKLGRADVGEQGQAEEPGPVQSAVLDQEQQQVADDHRGAEEEPEEGLPRVPLEGIEGSERGVHDHRGREGREGCEKKTGEAADRIERIVHSVPPLP
ncbi:MAG TPA: hypothetical protein DIC34_12410 [Treponema sp.]|nr:hypothetical protein [Treponema sp.]